MFTEVLRTQEDAEPDVKKKSTNELKRDTALVKLFRSAIESASDDSGWARLSTVGSNIAKQSPEFDPRNYGYNKLGELVTVIRLFDIEEKVSSDGHSKIIYLRDRRKKLEQ